MTFRHKNRTFCQKNIFFRFFVNLTKCHYICIKLFSRQNDIFYSVSFNNRCRRNHIFMHRQIQSNPREVENQRTNASYFGIFRRSFLNAAHNVYRKAQMQKSFIFLDNLCSFNFMVRRDLVFLFSKIIITFAVINF